MNIKIFKKDRASNPGVSTKIELQTHPNPPKNPELRTHDTTEHRVHKNGISADFKFVFLSLFGLSFRILS